MIYHIKLGVMSKNIPDIYPGDVIVVDTGRRLKVFRTRPKPQNGPAPSCGSCALYHRRTRVDGLDKSYCACLDFYCHSGDNYTWEEVPADQLMEDVL